MLWQGGGAPTFGQLEFSKLKEFCQGADQIQVFDPQRLK
jgi:hypothetical protein